MTRKREREREKGKLAQELRPAVLSGCVRCLMRQRDLKTDSRNEMADGHAVEKDTHIMYTPHTHTQRHRYGDEEQDCRRTPARER